MVAAEATNNSITKVMNDDLVIVDLTFGKSSDFYTCPFLFHDYTWSIYGYTGANAQKIKLAYSSGVFTLTANAENGGATPTAIGVKLWMLVKQ